jgi:hypothetical protein
MNIAGVDMLFEYREEDDDLEPSERFFQLIRSNRIVHATNQNCGDTPQQQHITLIEMFEQDENWDVITVHACNEMRIEQTWESQVGIIDLNDLPDPIRGNLQNHQNDPNRNVLIIGIINHTPLPGQQRFNPNIPGLTEDLFREIEEEIDDESTITWSAQYQYDGCNGVGNRVTQCGPNLILCLRIQAEDSETTLNRAFER